MIDSKQVLYTAVGAPITVAKQINSRLESLRSELETRTGDLGSFTQKQLDQWAEEGRQVVTRVSDGKMVDELTSKVDFDQAREQVSKLRDQLEDMLATWRSSFKPAEEAAGQGARSAASSIAEAGDKLQAATDEVEKTVRAKTTTRASSPTTASKKPAAKKPTTASKKPAAKKPTAEAS